MVPGDTELAGTLVALVVVRMVLVEDTGLGMPVAVGCTAQGVVRHNHSPELVHLVEHCSKGTALAAVELVAVEHTGHIAAEAVVSSTAAEDIQAAAEGTLVVAVAGDASFVLDSTTSRKACRS